MNYILKRKTSLMQEWLCGVSIITPHVGFEFTVFAANITTFLGFVKSNFPLLMVRCSPPPVDGAGKTSRGRGSPWVAGEKAAKLEQSFTAQAPSPCCALLSEKQNES